MCFNAEQQRVYANYSGYMRFYINLQQDVRASVLVGEVRPKPLAAVFVSVLLHHNRVECSHMYADFHKQRATFDLAKNLPIACCRDLTNADIHNINDCSKTGQTPPYGRFHYTVQCFCIQYIVIGEVDSRFIRVL